MTLESFKQAIDTAATMPLIEATNINKSFPLPEGNGNFNVLVNVNVTVREGEIVALLGRSGSGKSTLLRILAGLIAPTSGEVISSGLPVRGANPNVAMVFQSFALLPWLTVQQNVELGLEAVGVPAKERHDRAVRAIDKVGLDGFESAYPKELSGGMKQRVGFARAFVKQPQVLFMDEPFSALDVLTSENLRGEIGELWESGLFPARSVLIVTHNIEEAVLLSNRVIILGSNPGRIRGELMIDLPRPRDRSAPHFAELVDKIYTIMTNPSADVHEVMAQAGKDNKKSPPPQRFPPLPHVRVGGISGLLELVVDHGHSHDVADLAGDLQLSVDDLFPILDAAILLGFADVKGTLVTLTEAGIAFAEIDLLKAKELFRQQAIERIPLITFMAQTLKGKQNGSMRADFFLDILDEYYPEEEAGAQFKTAVDWGRYAELFEYDANEERLRLPDPVA